MRAVRGGVQLASSASAASFCCTWAAEGLHNVLPSANSSVGTVWLPPLTLSTNFAASGSSSMSTSVTSTPALPSCRLRFLQNPHQVVVYIVSGTGISLLLGANRLLLRFLRPCNNFRCLRVPGRDRARAHMRQDGTDGPR